MGLVGLRLRRIFVRLAKLLEDALGRELAVAELRALVLRDRAHDGPELFEHAPAFSAARSPADSSTSKIASARVELFCACWPPGPLERENRKAISDRIDSTSMAAILLDVDGVLHVSGAPIAGAAAAVRRLRDAGHRLRFVTNSTTRSRSQLAEQLRDMGIELEDDELQTPGGVAARSSRASACWR